MFRQPRALVLCSSLLLLAACGGGHSRVDGGDDGSTPDGSMDGGTGDGSIDGDVDGSMPDAGPPGCGMGPGTGPTITICAGDALPSLAEGSCEVTSAGAAMLITADVLTPGEVFRGGQVLVDGTGTITCVGCDCSGEAGAAGATTIVCPDAALSPGLINAHDHLTFDKAPPYDRTVERYEHRHDWRKGIRGHTKISSQGFSSNLEMQWDELRQVMSGTTSVDGSGGPDGFLRNLDSSTRQEGLGEARATYQTFPLGDSGGELLVAPSCAYPGIDTSADIPASGAYIPHVSEGIDAQARNEFLCVRSGANDLVQSQSAFIHGVGLLPPDMGEMAADGTMLIWSPRTNITLYGDTARVTEYARMGVPIALGTDWLLSGSMNMVRELRCAAGFNDVYLHSFFTDEELWQMATVRAAEAHMMDDKIGTIAVGRVADLALYDSRLRGDHRAVIESESGDVVLVLRGGVPLYGDAALVAGLPTGGACDILDVCGRAKRACISRELGLSFSALSASNADRYGLFFCADDPTNEPSCVPARDATSPFPSPEVNGSNSYDGVPTATDGDGDGIEDAMDNCPCTFNPIRPLDDGVQADFDMDGVGDACDVCPLDADTSTCTMLDPGDRDRDTIPNAMDNCPDVANLDQADGDMDGIGDVCDPCPMDANPGGIACPGIPSTIYQVKDGTRTVGENVSIEGGVVTGVGAYGYYMQVSPSDTIYAGPDFSGVFVYTVTPPTVSRGDVVDLSVATVADYYGQTELTNAAATVTSSGATLPSAISTTTAEVVTGGTRAAALEAMLVTVSDVTVSDAAPTPGARDTAPTGEFAVDDGLRVDDLLFAYTPFPSVGDTFPSITGVLTRRNDDSKLEPRDAADIVLGPPTLAALEPALTYVREGSTGDTVPTPLTVSLSRPAVTDTLVTLTSMSTGLTVSDVTILAGSISATVPVTGVTASPVPVTVTASLDGRMQTADVRVVGASEVPRLADLSPTAASVVLSGTQVFTVTLDLPAPIGGTTVMLALDMGGMVPPSVTVPADAISADFTFTAGTTATTGTLVASLVADMFSSTVTVRDAPTGHLVINEVDYDQPGTDAAEFLELYNADAAPVDLTNLSVVFINGSGGADYRTVALSGSLAAGGFLVMSNTGVVVPAGVTNIILPSNAIQNGAPDGILILDTSTDTIVDALSYEGAITNAIIGGTPGYNLVEGTATAVLDPGAGSMVRMPDGNDTDDASADWFLSATPTPGAANIAP